MLKNNEDIRQAVKEAGLKLWQISEKLNLNDCNFSRKLRHELPKADKEAIRRIIRELKVIN